MLKKFGSSFFWIQHVPIRLEHISKHFYQKMPSQVNFSGFPASLYEEKHVVPLRRGYQFNVENIELS